MLKDPYAEKYIRLRELLVSHRENSGLTQAEVAAKLSRPQSFVSKYENGERRLDVIELIEVANIIGFDPAKLIKKLG